VTNRLALYVALAGIAGTYSSAVLAQQAAPPPGYFDIPTGFDFPADKQTLEGFRTSGNLSAQRKHVWNVFAGMTQQTPGGLYVFETWYSEDETFQTGPTPQAAGPRRVVRRFRVPGQLEGRPGQPAPQAAGTALLSEVMFNFPNYNFVRSKRLFVGSVVDAFHQTGTPDAAIPNNRDIPAFPAESISLKTVWWPVAKGTITPMPIWDPESNPQSANGNPFQTWARVVAIDPNRTDIPPNETMTVQFHGARPNSHVVPMSALHSVPIDAQTATNAMENGRLRSFVNDVLGRDLQEGDFVVFAGTHLTTKEIDDWVWATFWWHDRPNDGPFAADRTDNVQGVWRNYLMSASYDLNLPREADNTAHIAFNPWLEAGFRDGVKSNCMNCHHRATFDGVSFLPVFRGNPGLQNDPAYAPNLLRTDFLWSIPFRSQ